MGEETRIDGGCLLMATTGTVEVICYGALGLAKALGTDLKRLVL